MQADLQGLSNRRMKELCSNWKDDITSTCLIFTCYKALEPCVQDILPKFSQLANSKIFLCTWKKQLDAAIEAMPTGSCTLLQEVVYRQVWGRTVSFCQELICALKSNTMLLSQIEEVFKLIEIKSSITSLVRALSSCFPLQVPPDTDWIRPVCSQIKHFRLSLKCTECAQAILQLRDCLELTGDFSIIEIVAEQVT